MRHWRLYAGLIAMTVTQEAFAADAVANRTLGYVLTQRVWAVYQTQDAKAECPNGFNDGPREQYKLLFPDGGTKRSEMETHLAREAEVYFPSDVETLPFHEVAGDIGIGMNLDGKVGPHDYTSPDGERGIDNQFYRVVGCVPGFRGPDGAVRHFENEYMQQENYNRTLIEITSVDDLVNDPDVTITTYHGLSPLAASASGKDFIAGSVQEIDGKWGEEFVQHFKGKIVDGVLTSDAADLKFPNAIGFGDNAVQTIKAARFRLKLSPVSAEGMIGGYVDAEDYRQRFTRAWSTHHASYGQVSVPSVYRAMLRAADAYPNPTTGKNTAVSAALEVRFTQAYLLHPEPPAKTASPGIEVSK